MVIDGSVFNPHKTNESCVEKTRARFFLAGAAIVILIYSLDLGELWCRLMKDSIGKIHKKKFFMVKKF